MQGLAYASGNVLESTGHSILNGILVGIKSRVGKQLIEDFSKWF